MRLILLGASAAHAGCVNDLAMRECALGVVLGRFAFRKPIQFRSPFMSRVILLLLLRPGEVMSYGRAAGRVRRTPSLCDAA